MSDTKFIDLIKSKYGDLVLDSHNFRGDQTVTVRKDCGNDFFKFLIIFIVICLSKSPKLNGRAER
mgnify:CR=1 FL=1